MLCSNLNLIFKSIKTANKKSFSVSSEFKSKPSLKDELNAKKNTEWIAEKYL